MYALTLQANKSEENILKDKTEILCFQDRCDRSATWSELTVTPWRELEPGLESQCQNCRKHQCIHPFVVKIQITKYLGRKKTPTDFRSESPFCLFPFSIFVALYPVSYCGRAKLGKIGRDHNQKWPKSQPVHNDRFLAVVDFALSVL